MIEKNKEIDTNNRLFNKELGGGCILDLGCYPTSFSLLIASMTAHYPVIGSLSELDDVLGDLGTGGKGHALARP